MSSLERALLFSAESTRYAAWFAGKASGLEWGDQPIWFVERAPPPHARWSAVVRLGYTARSCRCVQPCPDDYCDHVDDPGEVACYVCGLLACTRCGSRFDERTRRAVRALGPFWTDAGHLPDFFEEDA
ncbi:MAG: hypothetical protein R3B09_32375 [Nannocystaceae bacterium]